MMQSLRHLFQHTLHSKNQIEIGGRTLRIEKQLAEGGYAYVSLAQDTVTGELFAVKRLPFADEEGFEMAAKEMHLLESLPHHENLVKYHGSLVGPPRGLSGGPGEVLLLLEYCSGGTLIDLLQRTQRPREGLHEDVIRRVLLHVARGLAHLHTQTPPIVHCDLKAENILWGPPSPSWGAKSSLEEPKGLFTFSLGGLWARAKGDTPDLREVPEGLEGVFRVCDFGSCLHGILDPSIGGRKEKLQLAERIEKQSTLAYRAPEMVDLYLEYPIGPPADIWMLGCVLFILCFYRHPFEGASALAISNGAYSIPPGHKYSGELMALLRCLLSIRPWERPTAQQLAAALETPGGLVQLLQDQQQQKQQRPKHQEQQQKQHKHQKKQQQRQRDIFHEELVGRSKSKGGAEADTGDECFDPCSAAHVPLPQQQEQQQQQQQQHATDPWGQPLLPQEEEPWEQQQQHDRHHLKHQQRRRHLIDCGIGEHTNQKAQQQSHKQQEQELLLQQVDFRGIETLCAPCELSQCDAAGGGSSSSSSRTNKAGALPKGCENKSLSLLGCVPSPKSFGLRTAAPSAVGAPASIVASPPTTLFASAVSASAAVASGQSPPGSSSRKSCTPVNGVPRQELLLERMLVMSQQAVRKQNQDEHSFPRYRQASSGSATAASGPMEPPWRSHMCRTGASVASAGVTENNSSSSDRAAAGDSVSKVKFRLSGSMDVCLLRLRETKPQPSGLGGMDEKETDTNGVHPNASSF